jgi:antitoxin (DNA-binding transcriptional repressor) of toxin-antitoxin stability system
MVVITRRGRPVAALVGAEEFDRLRRLRSAGPEAGLASVAGGWEGSAELAERIDASPRCGRRSGVQLDQAWRTSSTPTRSRTKHALGLARLNA